LREGKVDKHYEVLPEGPTPENPKGLRYISEGEPGTHSPTAGPNADIAATREIRIQSNKLFGSMFDADGRYIGTDNTVPLRVQKIQEKAKELHRTGKYEIENAVATAFEQVEGIPMQAFIDATQRFNADQRSNGLSLGPYDRQTGKWKVIDTSGRVVGAFK
jgi:hypothetical protein